MFKPARNSRKEIELYSMLFCLLAVYGQKATFSRELLDLLKLYDIDLDLSAEQLREVLLDTAGKCPGEHITSFIFADKFISTLKAGDPRALFSRPESRCEPLL